MNFRKKVGKNRKVVRHSLVVRFLIDTVSNFPNVIWSIMFKEMLLQKVFKFICICFGHQNGFRLYFSVFFRWYVPKRFYFDAKVGSHILDESRIGHNISVMVVFWLHSVLRWQSDCLLF